MLRIKQFQNGSGEFPIVKDTTPNMMNPRLYTTSYNKPQGQQFDDTAVLSITIYLEPDMVASHIPFQLVPKLQ